MHLFPDMLVLGLLYSKLLIFDKIVKRSAVGGCTSKKNQCSLNVARSNKMSPVKKRLKKLVKHFDQNLNQTCGPQKRLANLEHYIQWSMSGYIYFYLINMPFFYFITVLYLQNTLVFWILDIFMEYLMRQVSVVGRLPLLCKENPLRCCDLPDNVQHKS